MIFDDELLQRLKLFACSRYLEANATKSGLFRRFLRGRGELGGKLLRLDALGRRLSLLRGSLRLFPRFRE